ncbi:alpha/beta-hydrolase [Daedaleopsis nitida]|nr:alpha/beta-hydrolase [Daedaleopsis nitida]
MSAILAGPPGECCRQTVQHVGEPRGKIEKVAEVETYVARPASGSNARIILFFADVYGPMYVNAQLLMDYWAENGYLVVGLDYFEGDSMIKHPNRDEFDYVAWRTGKQERAADLVPKWVEDVRTKYGSEYSEYFCVGYCFGAPYVMEHLATADWVVAGAFGHPAFLSEAHFQNIKKPLLLSCSEIDHTFPLDKRRIAEDILVANKATYFIQVFGSVQHGFALRGDPNVPIQRWAKEESARSVMNWFDHFATGAKEA